MVLGDSLEFMNIWNWIRVQLDSKVEREERKIENAKKIIGVKLGQLRKYMGCEIGVCVMRVFYEEEGVYMRGMLNWCVFDEEEIY